MSWRFKFTSFLLSFLHRTDQFLVLVSYKYRFRSIMLAFIREL